jgi:hypothetical protein
MQLFSQHRHDLVPVGSSFWQSLGNLVETALCRDPFWSQSQTLTQWCFASVPPSWMHTCNKLVSCHHSCFLECSMQQDRILLCDSVRVWISDFLRLVSTSVSAPSPTHPLQRHRQFDNPPCLLWLPRDHVRNKS